MKKFLSLVLAGILMLSLSVGASARAAGNKTAAKTYAVEVIDHNTRYPFDAVIYKPKGVEPKIGMVFYAGQPVDYREYGTLLKRIAAAGYLVISPEFPLDTAVLNIPAGREYMKFFPEVKEWFLAGHSHGGGTVMAEASLKPDLYQGLILLDGTAFVAALPDNYPVLTFHATEDLAVNLVQHKLQLAVLSNCNVTEVIIKGGNHAQFGDYGTQFNDGKAKISKKKQLDITLKHIMKFMKKYA